MFKLFAVVLFVVAALFFGAAPAQPQADRASRESQILISWRLSDPTKPQCTVQDARGRSLRSVTSVGMYGQSDAGVLNYMAICVMETTPALIAYGIRVELFDPLTAVAVRSQSNGSVQVIGLFNVEYEFDAAKQDVSASLVLPIGG